MDNVTIILSSIAEKVRTMRFCYLLLAATLLLVLVPPASAQGELGAAISEAQPYVSAALTIGGVAWKIADWMGDNLWHMWWYVEYKDGFRIYNRFKGKRRANNVIDHFNGRTEGDCDAFSGGDDCKTYWCFPDEKRSLYDRHGEIFDIGVMPNGPPGCDGREYAGVTLYYDAPFKGYYDSFQTEIPNLRDYRLNDEVSAVQLRWPICEIILYEDKDYGGRSIRITEKDVPDLDIRKYWFNDKASSMKVIRCK